MNEDLERTLVRVNWEGSSTENEAEKEGNSAKVALPPNTYELGCFSFSPIHSLYFFHHYISFLIPYSLSIHLIVVESYGKKRISRVSQTVFQKVYSQLSWLNSSRELLSLSCRYPQKSCNVSFVLHSWRWFHWKNYHKPSSFRKCALILNLFRNF